LTRKKRIDTAIKADTSLDTEDTAGFFVGLVLSAVMKVFFLCRSVSKVHGEFVIDLKGADSFSIPARGK
jgi:hypothetical protein